MQVLVDNASVHGAGPVTVSASRTGRAAAVDVNDAAPGSAGDLDAIFQLRSASQHVTASG